MADNFTKDGAPSGGIVLHPRAYVTLKVIIDGDELDTGFTPSKVSLRRGSHNKADECEVTIDGAVLQIPLRLVGGSFACVYLGVVDEPEDITSLKKDKNLRFCGYFEEADQDWGERSLSFKSQDLSRRLREHKPLIKKVVNGVTIDPTPRYTDTLEQAIRRILSVVPGFEEQGAEPIMDLRATDALSSARLSSLVSGRALNGPVAIKPDWSAWQAIEHVCGLCSRHVGVELREIVVRSPTEVFSDADPDPEKRITFIIGAPNANAYPPKFHKKFINNRKGVKVVAWDTEQRKQVSALYPDDNDMRQSFPRKRPQPKKVKSSRSAHTRTQPKELKEPDRDVFELDPGVYTTDELLNQAKKIWLERASQECDGTIETPLWDERILDMRNGARFFVKLFRDIEEKIAQIGDDVLAARLLQQELPGMTLHHAELLLHAIKKPLQDFWYCRTVTLDWPSDKLAHVDFINLLEI